jgi:hypothetical protein
MTQADSEIWQSCELKGLGCCIEFRSHRQNGLRVMDVEAMARFRASHRRAYTLCKDTTLLAHLAGSLVFASTAGKAILFTT